MLWEIKLKRLLSIILIPLFFTNCVYSPPKKQLTPEDYPKELSTQEEPNPIDNQYAREDKKRDLNCFYSENCHCKTPGKTLYWKHLYCLKLHATKNSNDNEVQSCTFGRDSGEIDHLNECQKNYHWRLNRCMLITPKRSNRREVKVFDKCLNKVSGIPRLITTGF
jgi:hypothetical protein